MKPAGFRLPLTREIKTSEAPLRQPDGGTRTAFIAEIEPRDRYSISQSRSRNGDRHRRHWPHPVRAHGHSRAYVWTPRSAQPTPHVRSEKIIGLARSASPTLRGLMERISGGVGQARGYSIRI